MQAAMAFWWELLLCLKSMGMVDSTKNPCLYYKWSDDELILIVSWIDDSLIIGTNIEVEKTKMEPMEWFDYKDCRELEEYLGCK